MNPTRLLVSSFQRIFTRKRATCHWKKKLSSALTDHLDELKHFYDHDADGHSNHSWLPKIQKAYRRLHELYPLLNRKSHSLRYINGKLLYMSLLRPILTYACPVWQGTYVTRENMKKVQTSRNKVLRIASHSPGTSQIVIFVRNSI